MIFKTSSSFVILNILRVNIFSFSNVALVSCNSRLFEIVPSLISNCSFSVLLFSSSFPSLLPTRMPCSRPSLLNPYAILSIPSHISISSPSGKSLIKSKLPVMMAA